MDEMKLTKRKGFNFFRSYYDVYNLLNDQDKVAFMDALLDRQFLGVKPEDLKGQAQFAYISQTNSIDSQVKGWEDKTRTKLHPPYEGGTQGGSDTPTEQVEEKGKEKEEVKEDNTPTAKALDFDKLLTYINKTFSRKYKVINKDTRQKYKARQKEGYTSEDIKRAIDNCKRNEFHIEKNFSYCTPLFFSQSKTLEMYGTETAGKKSNTYNPQG